MLVNWSQQEATLIIKSLLTLEIVRKDETHTKLNQSEKMTNYFNFCRMTNEQITVQKYCVYEE